MSRAETGSALCWAVLACTGEYSSYEERIVAVYLSEPAARERARLCNEWALAHGMHADSPYEAKVARWDLDYEEREKVTCPHDPDTTLDTDTRWVVREAPLLG